jgi:hypothetical protein
MPSATITAVAAVYSPTASSLLKKEIMILSRRLSIMKNMQELFAIVDQKAVDALDKQLGK